MPAYEEERMVIARETNQRLAEITDHLKHLGFLLTKLLELAVHEHVDGRDHAHEVPQPADPEEGEGEGEDFQAAVV